MVCDYLITNIAFLPNRISSCACSANGTGVVVYADEKNNPAPEKVISEYINCVNQYCRQFEENIIPQNCKGCTVLSDKTHFTQEKVLNTCGFLPKQITRINIAHWYYCNQQCIYCCHKEVKDRLPQYDILKYLKLLKEYISDDCRVMIGGGEPGILKNFDKILKFFMQFDNSNFAVMSNLIVWRNEYKHLLKSGRMMMNVSLDCSNRDLFKKIKQIDKFNVVVNNIKKCAKYQKNDWQTTVKYIIIENVNDSEQNIIDFLNLLKELNIKNTGFCFDRNSYNFDKEVPENILHLYKYAQETAAEQGFDLYKEERCEAIYQTKRYV